MLYILLAIVLFLEQKNEVSLFVGELYRIRSIPIEHFDFHCFAETPWILNIESALE